MKHLSKLTEEEACAILKKITQVEAGAWNIQFIEDQGHIRLDMDNPIVCDALNLQLFGDAQNNSPECIAPNCKIIGIFGDDEFAWVCRKSDGTIMEMDEYDIKKNNWSPSIIFPSLSHYLLFILDYQA